MKNYFDAGIARELVHFFSTISSTEDLIVYVAGEEGMLSLCQNLIEEFDHDTKSQNVLQLNHICNSQGILVGLFYSEVRKVLLALNQFHDNSQNHYEILGLKTDVTVEEVKKAYRKLSMQYHPDRAKQADGNSDHFMRIAGAYHSIMINHGNNTPKVNTSWRDLQNRKRHQRSRSNRGFVLGFIVLLTGLVLVSLYLSERFSSKALLLRQRSAGPISSSQQDTLSESSEKTSVTPDTLAPTVKAESEIPVHIETNQIIGTDTTTFDNLKDIEAGPHQIAQQEVPQHNNEIHSINQNRDNLGQVATPSSSPPETNPSEPDSSKETTVTKSDKYDNIPPLQAAEKQEDSRINAFNTDIKISYVLKQYTTLYNRKELSQYLELFTDNATENGNPIATEIEKYKEIFSTTEKINLRLQDIDWEVSQYGFQVQGTFVGDYIYKNGNKQKLKGDIFFQLRDEQNSMKIESLVYFFKKDGSMGGTHD